ncbi:MAG: hypothetical protein Q4P05_08690, partial [Actinomycetaceae bacterium]|nr:hypothetical protein [Actinomycetaceae bacterium]
VTNVATVSSDTPDPNTDNNEATAKGEVIPRPQQTLAVTGVNAGPQALTAFALFLLGFLLVMIRRRQES